MPQKQKESAEGILCSSWNCGMSGNRLGDPNLVQNWLRRKQCEDCTVPGGEVLAAQLPRLHRNQSLQPPLPSKLGSSNLAHKSDSVRPSPQNNTSLTQVKWLVRHGHTPGQKQNDWRYCDIFITWEKWNKDNSSLTGRIFKCRWRRRKCLSPPGRIGRKRG